MSDPLLDFGIDLDSVRTRVEQLTHFTSVTNLQEATLVLENMNALPPAAFVSIAAETAGKNLLATGLSQRVETRVSVLFCVPAEQADDKAGDELESTRKAVVRILHGWTPDGALKPLEYDRYLLRASGDGLIWGEVLMLTAYRLSLPD